MSASKKVANQTMTLMIKILRVTIGIEPMNPELFCSIFRYVFSVIDVQKYDIFASDNIKAAHIT